MGSILKGCCEESQQEVSQQLSKSRMQHQDPELVNNPFLKKAVDKDEEDLTESTIAQILDKKAKVKAKIDFEDFQIDGKLGEGGFGVVYLGQLKSNLKKGKIEKYAIKKVSKQLLIKKKVYSNAIDEKNILAMYTCKFIVELIMAFQDPWYIYFVMECASGDTYSLIKKGSLKTPQFKEIGQPGVRFIAGCVILGLEFLHKNDYMYRDLKPENVLLFPNGYAKLTDFGLAKKSIEGISSKTISGTQFYYAPQMVLKKGYGKQVDIWTLGVYLYELSVFEPPFTSEQITRQRIQAVCLEAQNNRNWKNANVSPVLKDLINGILKFDPKTRLGTNGWQQIKDHAFFKGFNWNALENMEMESPLKDLITKYPISTKPYRPDPPKPNRSVEYHKVEGFTYTNDK